MTHVDLITLQAFQYIPCYCLSQNRVIHAIEIFISIHPMLLFIVVVPEITNDRLIFQYIPCYCLSMLPPAFFCVNSYFNTSHVTVYLLLCKVFAEMQYHFNTSHVTVYPTRAAYGHIVAQLSRQKSEIFIMN